MSRPLSHSSVVVRQVHDFLTELEEVLGGDIALLKSSSGYRSVFKTSLATYSVLVEFSRREVLPFLKGAAGVARRVPLLLACRQVSLSYVELRRFVELAVWYVYFKEHPVEWEEFAENPSRGFLRDVDKPVSYCAHREIAWYLAYTRERFKNESSGLAVSAVNALSKHYAELSAQVHAASGTLPRLTLAEPFDKVDQEQLSRFRKSQKAVFANGALLVAALKPKRLGKLGANERSWFDWLIGKRDSRRLRGGPFGLD